MLKLFPKLFPLSKILLVKVVSFFEVVPVVAIVEVVAEVVPVVSFEAAQFEVHPVFI